MAGDLSDYVPEAWRGHQGKGYMAAYLMPGMPNQGIVPPFTVDLGEVCVIMGWIGLPQFGITHEYKHEPDGGLHIVLKEAAKGDLRDPAPVSLFITTLDEAPPGVTIPAARARIQEATGLLGSWSHTLVFEHVEDYNIEFSDGIELQPASTLLTNTLFHDVPTVGPALAGMMSTVSRAIGTSSAQDRIRLSLRWLDDAKRANGTDAFLRLWVALETLAMPDNTNIRPLRERLQAIYGVPNAQDGETRFGIRRIYTMRNRIVHHGERIDPPPMLLKYMAEIYVDILALTLEMFPSDRAQEVLAQVGGVENVLPAAVGGRGEAFEEERRRAGMGGDEAQDGRDEVR